MQEPGTNPYGQPAAQPDPYGEDPSGPNPYQQGPYQQNPAVPGRASVGPPREALAGFWIRLIASLVDNIALGAIAGLLAGLSGLDGRLFQSILSLGYFTYFHGSAAGQTVGNKLLGIRVASVDTGRPLSYGHAALRWLVSLLSGLIVLLGYLWMLWDPMKQTWHDKAAGSVVIKTHFSPAPGPFAKPGA